MLPSGPARVHFGSRGLMQGTQGSLQGSPVTLAGGHEETHLLVLLFLVRIGWGGQDGLLLMLLS